MKPKIIIYQLLPRLFTNSCQNPTFNGTIDQNGCGKFDEISKVLLTGLRNFGITHIWLTGILRHATLSHYPLSGLPASHPDIVKGKAGSPYAVSDYFDVDPDLAVDVQSRMKEFAQLIERIHSAGLKVMIDFIPNHVARDYHSRQLPKGFANLGETDDQNLAFSPSNNFYYLPGQNFRIRNLQTDTPDRYQEFPARVTGNDVFRPDPDINDWYETVKINYGFDYQTNQAHFHPLPDTWIKMTEILLFWSNKGVDGFRCDMAGMVPIDFWQYAISQVKREYGKVLFIAELYEPWKYRDYLETGLFDYLYDKAGLYDTLRAVIRGESTTRSITNVWQSLEGMDDQMVRFLENHDEQRVASGFFAGNPWKGIPGMAVCILLNRGPAMIYAGQEVGTSADGATGFSADDGRTTIFDYSTIPELQDWINHGLLDGQKLSPELSQLRFQYSELLNLAGRYPAISNGSMYDLMWVNEDIPNRDRIFAFLRYGGTQDEEALIIAVCFDATITETQIRVPEHALITMGLGDKQRIRITEITSDPVETKTLLVSQLATIGLQMKLNPAGYAVCSIS
ncbi:MAG: alpha-amylase family protein [Bacteroidales bacterium]